MAGFIGQGPPMRLFDRHVKQPITVRFVQRHVSVRGNVATITDQCVTVCKIENIFLGESSPQETGDYFQVLRHITAPAALMVRQQSSLIISPEWEYSS